MQPVEDTLSADQIREFLHESRSHTTMSNGDFDETVLNPAKLEKIILKQTFLESNHLFDPAVYFGGLQIEDLAAKNHDHRLSEMFKVQQQQEQTKQKQQQYQQEQKLKQPQQPLNCASSPTQQLSYHQPVTVPSLLKPLADLTNQKKLGTQKKSVSPLQSKRKAAAAATTASPIESPCVKTPLKPAIQSTSSGLQKNTLQLKKRNQALVNNENVIPNKLDLFKQEQQHQYSPETSKKPQLRIAQEPVQFSFQQLTTALASNNNSIETATLKHESIQQIDAIIPAVIDTQVKNSLSTTTTIHSKSHRSYHSCHVASEMPTQHDQQQQQPFPTDRNYESSFNTMKQDSCHSIHQQQQQDSLTTSMNPMCGLYEQKLTSEQFLKDKEKLELTFQDEDPVADEVVSNPTNYFALHEQIHADEEESYVTFSKQFHTFQNDLTTSPQTTQQFQQIKKNEVKNNPQDNKPKDLATQQRTIVPPPPPPAMFSLLAAQHAIGLHKSSSTKNTKLVSDSPTAAIPLTSRSKKQSSFHQSKQPQIVTEDSWKSRQFTQHCQSTVPALTTPQMSALPTMTTLLSPTSRSSSRSISNWALTSHEHLLSLAVINNGSQLIHNESTLGASSIHKSSVNLVKKQNGTSTSTTNAYLRRPEGKGSFDFRQIYNSNNGERSSNNSNKQPIKARSPDVSPTNYKVKATQQLHPMMPQSTFTNTSSQMRLKKMQHRIQPNQPTKQQDSSSSSQMARMSSTAKSVSNQSVQSSQVSSVQIPSTATPVLAASATTTAACLFQSSQQNTSNPFENQSLLVSTSQPQQPFLEHRRSPSAVFQVDSKYDAILSHLLKMNHSTPFTSIKSLGSVQQHEANNVGQ